MALQDDVGADVVVGGEKLETVLAISVTIRYPPVTGAPVGVFVGIVNTGRMSMGTRNQLLQLVIDHCQRTMSGVIAAGGIQ